jgi:sugar phosphate isomerase/epimerase
MLPSPIQMLKFLPEGWESKCLELGVIKRVREIKNPEDLMTLDLFHLLHGCTLLEMSIAAKALKIANISDVAFMKRF